MSEIATVLDIRKVAEQAKQHVAPDTGSPVATASPQEVLVPRRLAIDVTYFSPDTNEKLSATVFSHVPDQAVKTYIMRTEADLCAGRPFGLLPPDKQAWVQMIARVSHQVKDAPEWLYKWMAEDDELLGWLANYCLIHENLFFRRGAAASGATQSGTRMALTSAMDSRVKAIREGTRIDG